MKIRKNILLVGSILIIIIFLSNSVTAVPNPSAVYCKDMGYQYKTDKTPEGEKGICVVDSKEFNAWEFFRGKVGKEYSYCAKKGYDTKTERIEKEGYSEEYAVCVTKKGFFDNIKSVFGAGVEEEIIPMHELMEQEKELSIDTEPYKTEKNVENKEKLSIAQDDVDSKEIVSIENVGAPPSSFDWRNYNSQNWVTSVKDQATCGGCWAFSAVGATEAKLNIDNNDPNLDYDLSEQHLISCDCPGTCNGGWNDIALAYIRDTGVADENCLPFTAWNSPCNLCSDWKDRAAYITDYYYIPNTQAAYKQALVDYGPLSVLIRSGYTSFKMYSSGIFVEPASQSNEAADHAVVLVGWNDAGGYWIIKNSWGAVSWGEDGYMRISYTNGAGKDPILRHNGAFAVEQSLKPITRGVLQPYIINMPTEVAKDKFFTAETGVRCVDGYCGDVEITLTLPFQPTTCSEVWGFDCGTGPPDGDNTFDDCSSSGGNDESIDEIYLDKSELDFGEEIEVKCLYNTRSGKAYAKDRLYIYYRNSPTGTWVKKAEHDVSSPPSLNNNYSAIFFPDSIEGEHQIRCMAGYDISGDECAEAGEAGPWYDNDDANFFVYDHTSGKGKVPLDYGSPFYTIDPNPQNCTNMTDQSTCNQTWIVNATGPINSSWLLYTSYTSNYKVIETKETAKINITIVKEIYLPPEVHSIECYDGSNWIDCSTLAYSDTIKQVRANCTSDVATITSASFKLTNIPDNNIFFDNNGDYNPSSGYWEYDNSDILIEDSGDWELTVRCIDTASAESSRTLGWSVPFGYLESYLINPTAAKDVQQNKFFEFSSGVKCVGGECGNINAILDPIRVIQPDSLEGKDSWVTNVNPNNNYGDSSEIRILGSTLDNQRGILYFNLSVIPSGSTIVHANLTLYDYAGYVTSSQTLSVFRVTNSWTESEVTWYNKDSGSDWTAPGGDHDLTIEGSSVLTTHNRFYTWDITGLIQKWVSGTPNYGMLIYGTSGDTGYRRFCSSDYFTQQYRPKLEITYIEGIQKGIIPLYNGTPFYTIDQNPTTCTDLKASDSCNNTWQVNATGELNSSYEFFTIYDAIQYPIASKETVKVNITIVQKLIESFSKNLVQGWNLISIPLVLENNSIDYIFNNIGYSKIFSYVDNKYIELNDDDEINNKIGLWVKMNVDDTLIVEGLESSNTLINLNQGLNLISYPSLTEQNVDVVFNGINDSLNNIYNYENNNWYSYNPKKSNNSLEIIKPGLGYWVNVNESVTLQIP